MKSSDVCQELIKLAKELSGRNRKAGGTWFMFPKNPMPNYKSYVERNIAKWVKKTGDFSGDYVPKSLVWDNSIDYDTATMGVLRRFSFKTYDEDGNEWKQNAKVTARFEDNTIFTGVLIYD